MTTEAASGGGDRVSLPTAWIGTEEQPIFFVNQFAMQLGSAGDEIYLYLGVAQPPMVSADSEEELRDLIAKIPFVPIRTVSRIVINPRLLKELATVVERTMRAHEESQAGEGQDR